MNQRYFKRSGVKIICFTIILLMAFTVLPIGINGTVNAQVDVNLGDADTLEKGADLSGTQVYLGDYTGGDATGPLKWYVVDKDVDNNTATLFTTTKISSKVYSIPREGATNGAWSNANICKWLNSDSRGWSYYDDDGGSDGFLKDAFTQWESESMSAYGTTEASIYTDYGINEIDISQKIVLPSVNEIGKEKTTGTWDISYAERSFYERWHLRTPGYSDTYAAFVDKGSVISTGGRVSSFAFAGLPALKIKLDSVLFTSDASKTKKSAAVGNNLKKVSEKNTSAVALTLVNDDFTLDTNTVSVSAAAGEKANLKYTNATTGENMNVSVMICDKKTDKMLYYGRPVDLSNGSGSGTAQILIPNGLAAGNYTLKIFSEQVNDKNRTDYASKPETIDLKVLNKYTVTLNTNGGKNLSNNKLTVIEGQKYGKLPNPQRKGYTFSGWYTSESGGQKVTSQTPINIKGNQTLYAKWSKVTVGKSSVKKIKNVKKKKAKVYLKKVSNVKGYEISYADNKKFKKSKKASTTKLTRTLNKLKKNKTYYVKVRAYKLDSTGAKFYGKYSKVKKVNIKK